MCIMHNALARILHSAVWQDMQASTVDIFLQPPDPVDHDAVHSLISDDGRLLVCENAFTYLDRLMFRPHRTLTKQGATSPSTLTFPS